MTGISGTWQFWTALAVLTVIPVFDNFTVSVIRFGILALFNCLDKLWQLYSEFCLFWQFVPLSHSFNCFENVVCFLGASLQFRQLWDLGPFRQFAPFYQLFADFGSFGPVQVLWLAGNTEKYQFLDLQFPPFLFQDGGRSYENAFLEAVDQYAPFRFPNATNIHSWQLLDVTSLSSICLYLGWRFWYVENSCCRPKFVCGVGIEVDVAGAVVCRPLKNSIFPAFPPN